MSGRPPGPWTRGLSDKTVSFVTAGSRVICKCDDSGHRANARLIAAAPDLLDVAQAIVTAYGDLVLPSHTEKHLLDGARAAIAKAESR